MAGGMNKRGSWGSMAERIEASRTGDADSLADPPQIKPCWVTDPHGRLPGLLLEWRHRPDGWHGRVVRPVLDSEGWVVVEEWLPARLLEPA